MTGAVAPRRHPDGSRRPDGSLSRCAKRLPKKRAAVADAGALVATARIASGSETTRGDAASQAPPRLGKRRHSVAVSHEDSASDYHAHNLRHVDALHADFLRGQSGADDGGTAAVPLFAAFLCVCAGVGAVVPAKLIVDRDPVAMQLVMLGNYLYMLLFSLVGFRVDDEARDPFTEIPRTRALFARARPPPRPSSRASPASARFRSRRTCGSSSRPTRTGAEWNLERRSPF